MVRKRGNPARSAAAGVFIVLAALLVPAAVAVQWVETTLVDADGYVAVADTLIADPAVQTAVVHQLTTMVMEEVPALGGAAAGITTIVNGAVGKVVQADTFAAIWSTANRSMHSDAIAVLDGSSSQVILGADGEVSLDLTSVTTEAADVITSSGLVTADMLPAVDAVVPLTQSSDLVQAQGAYSAIVTLSAWLPWLAVVFIGVSVALAVSKAVGLAWVGGLTLAFTGLALGAAGPVGDGIVGKFASPRLSTDLVQSVTEVFTGSLVSALRLGLVVGAALVVMSVVVAGVGRVRAARP